MTDPCGKFQDEVDRLEAEIEGFSNLIPFANSKEKEDLKAKKDQAEKQLVQAKKDLQKCRNNPPKLPSGTWKINANNFPGTLFLQRPDSAGNVQGTVLGSPMTGFWDEPSGRLTFFRMDGDLGTTQVFTGYMFMGSDPAVMAGSFETFAGTGGTGVRSVFGWYAIWQSF